MRKDNKINDQITSSKVKVIDQNGKMLETLNTEDALKLALDAGLDLVEVSKDRDPPICKILDFKKFLYESKKHLHEFKKSQKRSRNILKEIKIKINTASGDLNVKIQRAREFLQDRNKVKISLLLKGREFLYKDRAFNLFQKIKTELNSLTQNSEENIARLEGKQIIMILNPTSLKKK